MIRGANGVKKALIRELRVWGGLQHPNVLYLGGFYYDVETIDCASIVTLWQENGNVLDHIRRTKPDEGGRLKLVRSRWSLTCTRLLISFLRLWTPRGGSIIYIPYNLPSVMQTSSRSIIHKCYHPYANHFHRRTLSLTRLVTPCFVTSALHGCLRMNPAGLHRPVCQS